MDEFILSIEVANSASDSSRLVQNLNLLGYDFCQSIVSHLSHVILSGHHIVEASQLCLDVFIIKFSIIRQK